MHRPQLDAPLSSSNNHPARHGTRVIGGTLACILALSVPAVSCLTGQTFPADALSLGDFPVVAAPACAQAEEASHVTISVDCKKNKMFSTYDVAVLVDGSQVATLAHGTSATYELDLADGMHELAFQNVDDSSVDGTESFMVAGATALSCHIECTKDQVEVGSLDVTNEGAAQGSGEGGGTAEAELISDVMVIGDASENASAVELRVKCDENLGFSRYDITVLVDGQTIASIDHGKDRTFDLAIVDGEHELLVQKKDDPSINGTCAFSASDGVCLFYEVHCTSGGIDIHPQNIASGSESAAASAEELQAKVDQYRGIDPSQYTPESWTALDEALASAESVLAEQASGTADFMAADDALDRAFENLCPSLESYGYQSYEELMRYPDNHEGELLVYSGSVLQVIDGFTHTDLRISLDGGYDTVIMARYDPSELEPRVLEGDYVTVYGTFDGLRTYSTVLGAQVTVPHVNVDTIVLNG